MSKYPKIQSVFKRDPENNFKTFLEGQYSLPEFAILRNTNWEWTEKVDGTNIRVEYMWGHEKVFFKGRTDNAQMPTFLLTHLAETFSAPQIEMVFCDGMKPEDGDVQIVLYGEGYGAKIQKGGGLYIPDGVGFILFDVSVGGIWLERESVVDIAKNLGVPVVPRIGRGSLDAAIRHVKNHPPSQISAEPRPMEGLVMRAPCGLLTRMGKRIITKIKTKDFTD